MLSIKKEVDCSPPTKEAAVMNPDEKLEEIKKEFTELNKLDDSLSTFDDAGSLKPDPDATTSNQDEPEKTSEDDNIKSEVKYEEEEEDEIDMELVDSLLAETMRRNREEAKNSKNVEIVSVAKSNNMGRQNDVTTEDEEILRRKELGLPLSFALIEPMTSSKRRLNPDDLVTESGSSKKKKSQLLFCDVCNVDLYSPHAMAIHENGARHKKKVRMKMSDSFIAGGDHPQLLLQRLAGEKVPIVGIKFVREIIACSDPTAEPAYDCTLCLKPGNPSAMASHILGRLHRENFLKNLFPTNRKYWDIKPQDSAREIEPYRENSNLELKETIYSDELYPWSQGRAPWSLEKGGTGIPPTSVRLRSLPSTEVKIESISDARKCLDSVKKMLSEFEKFLTQISIHDKDLNLTTHSDAIRAALSAFENILTQKESLLKTSVTQSNTQVQGSML